MSNDVDVIHDAVIKFNSRYKTADIKTDTAAAIISIEQNARFLKNKVHHISFFKKHNALLRLIKDNFPQADSGVVSNKLIGIGILPIKFYQAFVWIIAVIITSIALYYVFLLNYGNWDDIKSILIICVIGGVLIALLPTY